MTCGAYILLFDLVVVVAIAAYWLYEELVIKRNN
jgi:hypothetical protein